MVAQGRSAVSVEGMSDHEQEPDNDDNDGDGPDLTPDDLKPGEDNPLAEPLEDDEARDDLDVLGGKTADEDDDDAEADDAEDDSEEE